MKKGIFLAILMATLFSCKKTDDNTTTPPTAEGTITGVIYSASRLKPVAHAQVTLAGSTQYQTFTDGNGIFSLKCPAGKQRFVFSVGSGEIFNGDFTAEVSADQSIEISHDSTTLHQEKQLAFVPGAFDSIQNIIRDSLGYTVTELTYSDLTGGNIQQYAVVFLNCGLPFSLDANVYSALDNYLQAGGNIYASDFAIDYLVGDGNLKKAYDHGTTSAQPRTICGNPQLGGFIEDSLFCHTKAGPVGIITGATVIDPTMQTIFGPTVDLNYNLAGWAILNHVETNDPRFKTLINDAANGPLLASIKWGNGARGGNIMFTTFHNEANINSDMVGVLQWIFFNY